MKKKYRILYVEDNPVEFEMVRAFLENADLIESFTVVERKREFLREIKREKYDLILTDFALESFHGFEVLQLVKKDIPGTPVIFITGSLPDEIAVEVIKKGAADYILLQNIYRLIPAVHSVVEKKRIKDEKDSAIKRLLESEENYRILAESSPFGIIVHSNGKLKYYNKQAVKFFAAEGSDNYHDLDILSFIHPDYHQIANERAANLYSGVSYPDFSELILLNRKGEPIQVEVASASITYNGIPSAQVIFRDIAERKRIETEIIKAKEKAEESDRLKTAFLENMSHEIRTPLNGIIGFSTLLKFKELQNPERLKYLEIIEQSGKHLLNIINDLIEISRIESGHVELRNEQVNLNSLLRDVYTFFSKSLRMKELPVEIYLHNEVADNDSFVITDPSRLKQVLINLLNNALKFTARGRIDFGYERPDKGFVRFFVKDTGIGIPEKSKEIVFERFRQADDEATMKEFGGTGLGLTISKGLIEKMEGGIWFDSVYGEGTNFYFSLPLKLFTSEEEGMGAMDDITYEGAWKSKNLLIAEDEQSNFVLLKHMLKNTGIAIERASTGKTVLEMLGKSQGKYDVILMDIKMPEMDGLEVIREIRNNKLSIPVIAQTAYAMTDDRQKCINAGFNEYITKPIKTKELLNKINLMLIKGSAGK